jgi:hypothetical protein
MKSVLLFFICCATVSISYAQKETFDIVNYTPPKAWKKQPAESTVQFSKEDEAKGTYCLITLYKAVPGISNAKENFEMAWASVVKETVTVSKASEMHPPVTDAGWETLSGYAPFENDGNKGVVILVTSSGFGKMVNLVMLTNTDVYEKEMAAFVESIALKKPVLTTAQTPIANDNKNSILGTWCISASDQSSFSVKNGVVSTIFRQYTFNASATYECNIKTFDPLMNSILLGRENGTYQINGNNLTINPQKSVLEEWSKMGGRDEWGRLLKTQNIALEKLTYQCTKLYIPENNEWQLILKAGNQTKRDGPFNNYDRNAWIYILTSAARPTIKLPN